MRLFRLVLLSAVAFAAWAQTPAWDNSGNGMLNGTYYFRQTTYVLSSAGTGALYNAVALYGTVAFSGTGTYSMSVTLSDGRTGSLQRATVPGTYSIAASGQGFLSNPLSSGDLVWGMVSAQGVFVGSSTENLNAYNDLFIAAPLGPTVPTAPTFRGSYQLAYIDLSTGNPLYTLGASLQMNPDGVSNVGTVTGTAYQGQSGSAKGTVSIANVKYAFSNGAAVVTFPNSTTALFSGQYYLYFSPDGNFVFGGSPVGYDMFVGVRTGTATPNLSGLYYEIGLDQDASTLNQGYASINSFFGAFSAVSGTAVGHQRLFDVFNASPSNYTYSERYNVATNGTYATAAMNYVVASGIRIGSGIGPYLGLHVALQAPTISSSASPSGVFLNPQGVVNAGSSAPFTAGLAPGELLTLYGANLAAATVIAPSTPFPTTLGKVQVTVNGINAPLYYVTPTQLSAIVPYGLTGAIAKVQVINDNVASNAVTMTVAKTAPGVLTQQQNGLGYGDVVHLDGTLVNAGNPAQIGETLLVFLTGLGAVSPTIADGDVGPVSPLAQTVSATAAYIGGITATVTYSGLAPQLAGLYQINVTVPSGVTAGDNYLDIAGSDGYTSECLIAIAAPPASAAAPDASQAVGVRRGPKAGARPGSR